MDAGDRVPFRVVPLQKGADGGEGNGAVIASGKHGEGDGSNFHRLFLMVDDVGRKIPLADVVHDTGEGVVQMGKLRVGTICGRKVAV